MKRFFKIVGVILLLISTLWIFNLVVVERVQAYMDAKDYLQQVYPGENLKIKKVDLDIIYGQYFIIVTPEHTAWYNPEFHLSWHFNTKRIGTDSRSPKINEYYWSIRDWRLEYARIIGEIIQQEYHGAYEANLKGYAVMIVTETFFKDKDAKALQEQVAITDSEFPTKDIPAEIVFEFGTIPEDERLFLEAELNCLKKIVNDNGYFFENYYAECNIEHDEGIRTDGYKLLPNGECVKTNLVWYGL